MRSGSVFSNNFQKTLLVFFLKFCKLECNTTSDRLNRVGLANQKLHYIQMLLNKEKSVELDKERSKEWLVNANPEAKKRVMFHTLYMIAFVI